MSVEVSSVRGLEGPFPGLFLYCCGVPEGGSGGRGVHQWGFCGSWLEGISYAPWWVHCVHCVDTGFPGPLTFQASSAHPRLASVGLDSKTGDR